ncbi:MAG: acyltransferase [Bacteroidales bacterium]|nr:acyltransferase [Bacteroidales bacterium]
MDLNFDAIRPYNDAEIPAAVQRIVDNPSFGVISAYLFPGRPMEEFRKLCLTAKTIDEFQTIVMWPVMQSIIEHTTDGITEVGFDTYNDQRKGIFVCNHRDILLDAALADFFLYKHDKQRPEITFGSNLMKGEMVIDIGKCNRMFRINRGGNMRDFYKNSLEVSAYMRHVVTEKKRSVWIAQRNGRTKNGDDKTEMAELKMFSLSSDKPFVENLGEINITPIAISYEFEPCDFLKVQELYVSKYQRYEKGPDEDLQSILKGITQKKGRINIVVTPTITQQELEFCDHFEKNKKYQKLAEIIDRRIYENYKLWPNNYIAYDILYQSCKYENEYSEEQKKTFVNYMDNGLSKLTGEIDEFREIFLNIYANPIINCENLYK